MTERARPQTVDEQRERVARQLERLAGLVRAHDVIDAEFDRHNHDELIGDEMTAFVREWSGCSTFTVRIELWMTAPERGPRPIPASLRDQFSTGPTS